MHKTPEWILRVGLGLMYLYSGVDIVLHPSGWHWAIRALPEWAERFPNALGLDRFLAVQGSVEILFALALLLPFVPRRFVRPVALLSALEMAAILAFVGIDAITFRDIGLLGASGALYFLLRLP